MLGARNSSLLLLLAFVHTLSDASSSVGTSVSPNSVLIVASLHKVPHRSVAGALGGSKAATSGNRLQAALMACTACAHGAQQGEARPAETLMF